MLFLDYFTCVWRELIGLVSIIHENAVSPYYIQEYRQARWMLSLRLTIVGGDEKVPDVEAVINVGVFHAISMYRHFIKALYIKLKFCGCVTDSSSCNSCSGFLSRWYNEIDAVDSSLLSWTQESEATSVIQMLAPPSHKE